MTEVVSVNPNLIQVSNTKAFRANPYVQTVSMPVEISYPPDTFELEAGNKIPPKHKKSGKFNN